jgi:hypothetical protein
MKRYSAFCANETTVTQVHHVALDLVQLKYGANVFGREVSKWTIVGDYFSIERVMEMITETHDEPFNLLIEVTQTRNFTKKEKLQSNFR